MLDFTGFRTTRLLPLFGMTSLLQLERRAKIQFPLESFLQGDPWAKGGSFSLLSAVSASERVKGTADDV